jgi:hypothetical protein
LACRIPIALVLAERDLLAPSSAQKPPEDHTMMMPYVFAIAALVSDPEPPVVYMTCARACADCQLRCDSCYKHCLSLVASDQRQHAVTAQLCVDCADCCKLGATLAARRSPLAGHACDCCAKCCDECAAACEKHAGDEIMANCARECRACAKVCRDMVQQVTAGR